MTGGKGRDLDSDSTRAPRGFRFEGTCSSSFAVVAVGDPPSRVFDDECEGWDPESDLSRIGGRDPSSSAAVVVAGNLPPLTFDAL